MTPNQSHLAGLELALQQWNNGGPAAHFAAQLRDLIDQAKAEPVDPAAGTEQVSSTWLAQLREEYLTFGSECQRLTAENARLRQHKTDNGIFSSWLKVSVSLMAVVFISGCATSPPSTPENLCGIFQEKPSWRHAAQKTQKK